MKRIKAFALLLGVVVLASCASQKRVIYLQDTQADEQVKIAQDYQIRIKPLDRLTVVVNSRDPELAAPFNTSTSLNSLTGTPLRPIRRTVRRYRSGPSMKTATSICRSSAPFNAGARPVVNWPRKSRTEHPGRRIHQRPDGQYTVRRHENLGHRRGRPSRTVRHHQRPASPCWTPCRWQVI